MRLFEAIFKREKPKLQIVLQKNNIESLVKDFNIIVVPYDHFEVELLYLDLDVLPQQRTRVKL